MPAPQPTMTRDEFLALLPQSQNEPMNNAEQPDFDYGDLAPDDRAFVKERADSIRDVAKKTAQGVIMIGQWLTEAKSRLKHGQWLPWLETEFSWSDRTARRLMQVHEAFKTDTVADLEIDVSALYLIAAPKTPEPVRLEIIRRAQSGEVMTKAKTVEVLETYKKRTEIPSVDPLQTVHELLIEAIAECRSVLEKSKATSPQAVSAGVWLVLVFIQVLDKLVPPSVSVSRVWVKISPIDPSGMDFCEQATVAAMNLKTVVKELQRCRV
jgi:hypothetical protein